MGKREKRERNRQERLAQAEAREARRRDEFRELVLAQTCPVCGVNEAAYIQYGLPMSMEALKPDLDAGLLVLGGCDIAYHMPRWVCRRCRHRWGRIGPEMS